MARQVRTPVWFWIVAVLLTLWGLSGCYACLRQFQLGADAMGPATAYQRELYASLPGWYNYVYAVAVSSTFVGGLLLLARSRLAQTVLLLSLGAVIAVRLSVRHDRHHRADGLRHGGGLSHRHRADRRGRCLVRGTGGAAGVDRLTSGA